MKIFYSKPLRICRLVVGFIALFVINQNFCASRFFSNDPFPVYMAGNPLGAYTYWEDCEPEFRAEFGLSFYRQEACKGRTNPFFKGSCDSTASCTNCQKICDKDVPLGDIHGHWDMLALFYPEANSNSIVRGNLIQALGLATFFGTTTEEIEAASLCIETISNPSNSDSDKEFGFFSVPIEYRKHGIRFEADIGTCWDIGLRIQTGVASIRQVAQFNDLTCDATNKVCDGCTVESFSCDCRTMVINGIMKQKDIVADTLGLCIDNYCDTQMEDITLSAYWSHCFEHNADLERKSDCWPHYTYVPYVVGEVSAPLAKSRPVNTLFALPFGNDRHWSYGFTGGFNINFIETIQIGLEAGFTKFSSEYYPSYPVPTNDLQTGMFSRKADLCIEPGTNWTFGATMGAYHFLDCLSTYIQFRHISHCCDCIKVVDTIKLNNNDNFPASNVKVKKMQDESKWNSSFVNVSFDYDISSNMALGFFWQAPVRQEFAYRPTTVMGTLIFNF